MDHDPAARCARRSRRWLDLVGDLRHLAAGILEPHHLDHRHPRRIPGDLPLQQADQEGLTAQGRPHRRPVLPTPSLQTLAIEQFATDSSELTSGERSVFMASVPDPRRGSTPAWDSYEFGIHTSLRSVAHLVS
ncbi:hypothetical protein SDC9_180112 [bioreactor metagenome]|uniref:Uncharacterized protein n=1 Tax=bioreactor metagenome TaxID=1076179 RepID=A0A645H2U5_9ZZZZ